jgi:hypothetical protein
MVKDRREWTARSPAAKTWGGEALNGNLRSAVALFYGRHRFSGEDNYVYAQEILLKTASNSGSSIGKSRDSDSIRLTLNPRLVKMNANSQPTASFPMKPSLSGSESKPNVASLVMIETRSQGEPGKSAG